MISRGARISRLALAGRVRTSLAPRRQVRGRIALLSSTFRKKSRAFIFSVVYRLSRAQVDDFSVEGTTRYEGSDDVESNYAASIAYSMSSTSYTDMR